MAESVLKINFFEFDSKFKQQSSGTVKGTKYALPYTCIFMDNVETDFLETQTVRPLVWLRYIFFIWNESEKKPENFLESLNSFHPNLYFTSEKSKKFVDFLDVTVSLIDQHLETGL